MESLRSTCTLTEMVFETVSASTGGESSQHVYADGDGVERQGYRVAAAQEGCSG